jgi:hypothetical protein
MSPEPADKKSDVFTIYSDRGARTSKTTSRHVTASVTERNSPIEWDFGTEGDSATIAPRKELDGLDCHWRDSVLFPLAGNSLKGISDNSSELRIEIWRPRSTGDLWNDCVFKSTQFADGADSLICPIGFDWTVLLGKVVFSIVLSLNFNPARLSDVSTYSGKTGDQRSVRNWWTRRIFKIFFVSSKLYERASGCDGRTITEN